MRYLRSLVGAMTIKNGPHAEWCCNTKFVYSLPHFWHLFQVTLLADRSSFPTEPTRIIIQFLVLCHGKNKTVHLENSAPPHAVPFRSMEYFSDVSTVFSHKVRWRTCRFLFCVLSLRADCAWYGTISAYLANWRKCCNSRATEYGPRIPRSSSR